ncbi:MAG: acyl carrier protein, partial [Piscinibacter sp.]|uniref:acyl carrier protein n=1 Tax=Piscinibacter sp. TaxID=1903157 RepID=UPI003D0EB5BA
ALGPVSGGGMAAGSTVRGTSLARLGFDGISARQAVEGIDLLLAAAVAHASCARFDARRWLAATQRAGAIGIVEAVDDGHQGRTGAERSLREQLVEAPAGAPRRGALESAIRVEVAAVLRMAPQRVPNDRALRALGLDSLMALELRNRLEKRTGVALSPTLAWNHPTVAAIAGHLAERMQLPLDEAPAPDVELDALLAELEQMSDHEARAQLVRGEGR